MKRPFYNRTTAMLLALLGMEVTAVVAQSEPLPPPPAMPLADVALPCRGAFERTITWNGRKIEETLRIKDAAVASLAVGDPAREHASVWSGRWQPVRASKTRPAAVTIDFTTLNGARAPRHRVVCFTLDGDRLVATRWDAAAFGADVPHFVRAR